jgi:A/G-specific adenine glycosylase
MQNLPILEFQTFILDWFALHARDLPWRRDNDPYHVLVSEIMSHQTQISRVVQYYHRWIQALPTIQQAWQVDTPTLLQLRQWLGYNNRALRLRECCRIISEQYDGIVPSDPQDLMKLPWIGLYTAHAISSFAYNLPHPVLDTNIKRVRFHHYPETVNMKESELVEFASQFIPRTISGTTPAYQSRLRHTALMDYGAVELAMHKSNIRINAKQSTFKGSTRRVRSHILKHLLKFGQTSLDELCLKYAIPRDYDRAKFDEIVQKMIKDGLIWSHQWIVSIIH